MDDFFWKLIESQSKLKKFQGSIKLIKYLLELNNKYLQLFREEL